MLLLEGGPHPLEPPQVQVDLPRADVAAPRHRDVRLPEAREQRPQHEDRGAHAADELV